MVYSASFELPRDQLGPGAVGMLADHGGAADAARQYQREIRQRLEQLQQQQRDLQAEVATAEQAALAAARDRDQAEKAHEAALGTLERAEQHLKESTKVG